MSLMRRQSGFSLIETTVAGAILLAACVAVSATLVTGLRASHLAATQSRLERLAASEHARLLALPYAPLVPGSSPGAEAAVPAPTLLHDLLDGAQPESASPGVDAEAGGTAVFVSRFVVGAAVVERRARFVHRQGSSWTDVPADALSAPAMAAGEAQASTVDVLIIARQGTQTATRVLRAGALSGTSAPPSFTGDGYAQ